jgi:hypothetical protein
MIFTSVRKLVIYFAFLNTKRFIFTILPIVLLFGNKLRWRYVDRETSVIYKDQLVLLEAWNLEAYDEQDVIVVLENSGGETSWKEGTPKTRKEIGS